MSEQGEIIIWEGSAGQIVPPNLAKPSDIANFAKQLTPHEKNQVVRAYEGGSYELATTFVWGKAISSLKRELGTLGVTFLAEVLGRKNVSESDNVLDVITEKEAIRLAEEFGVVSRTDALRLRNAQELVSHFAQRDSTEHQEPMEMVEAISVLLSCVKGVLAKPKVEVAKGFAEFRAELEAVSFLPNDLRIDTLRASPYFFRRLAVAVLLSGIKTHTGAKLEHCLNNINAILPVLWSDLRDPERWQVGTTYSHVYSHGLQLQSAGLKQALLKVRGFDYVPENLRSVSFVKAAEAIIEAHEGMNNFYNEASPVSHLERLGTVIPRLAIGPCVTALLCVAIGNRYGRSWAASPIAIDMLKKQGTDRWSHYLNNVLPGEIRVLDKLTQDLPLTNWIELASLMFPADFIAKDKNIAALAAASIARDRNTVATSVQKLLQAYYGSRK